jgi:ABC-2 type transport system ATP-binding protein
MSKADVKRRLPEVLDITDLKDVAYDVIGTLSHGYRQRVGVGQAIIHQPKFLILDEPTRGLDPVQIVEMRNLIHDLKQNHTVLISSHILTEISQTCDRLLVLGKGQMLAEGTEAELSGRKDDIHQITVLVRSSKGPPPYRGDAKDEGNKDKDKDKEKEEKDASGEDPKPGIKKLLGSIAGVESVGDLYANADGMAFSLKTNKDCRADVSRAVIDAKLDLLQLDFERNELESTFIRLGGGGSNAGN